MLSLGWSELFVIAVVGLCLVGPKDLPAVLRSSALILRKIRGLSISARKQVNIFLEEAGLQEAKQEFDKLRSFSPHHEIDQLLAEQEDLRDEYDNLNEEILRAERLMKGEEGEVQSLKTETQDPKKQSSDPSEPQENTDSSQEREER